MLVYVQVAVGPEIEVERSVFGEELQHVVQEADPGPDPVLATTFDGEPARNSRFLRIASNGSPSHELDSNIGVCVTSWLMSSITARAPSDRNSPISSSRRSAVEE